MGSKKKDKKGSTEEYLYQGVITHKEEIKKKFISMRNKIEAGNQPFIEEDWKRIKKYLIQLFLHLQYNKNRQTLHKEVSACSVS